METFEVLLATLMVCTTAYLCIRQWLNTKIALHKSKQISQRRARATSGSLPETSGYPDWLYDVIIGAAKSKGFNIDENAIDDILEEDTIPSWLEPIIKGFMQGQMQQQPTQLTGGEVV